MAKFILLEPSCDIHLILDAGFRRADGTPLNNLDLRVFKADWNGTHYDLSLVQADLHFDFFDPSASTHSPAAGVLPPTIDQARIRNDIVDHVFNAGTGICTLTPKAVGTVLMQLRYLDPDRATEHHHLVVRIQVHDTMNGWWFGNNSLSVYQDADLAQSQVILYALFDKDEPHGGIVGDISGHRYVELSSDATATVDLDINPALAGNHYRDRIRGISVGQTTLRGTLLGQNRDLTVRCVDLNNDPTDPPNARLVRKNAIFDDTVSRKERHNVLFLAEGFRDNIQDRASFVKAVTELSHDLLDCKRHSPFNLLKDSFNVWLYRQSSQETGITTGAEIASATRKAIPKNVKPRRGSPNDAYSLHKLIQLVGLPTPQDAELDNNTLKDCWNDTPNEPPENAPRLMGFQRNLAVNNVINAWQSLVPAPNIPDATNQNINSIISLRKR